MKFIHSDYIEHSILGDAERAAIYREIAEEYPGCACAEIVDAGIMVFDTVDEYETWIEQQ